MPSLKSDNAKCKRLAAILTSSHSKKTEELIRLWKEIDDKGTTEMGGTVSNEAGDEGEATK